MLIVGVLICPVVLWVIVMSAFGVIVLGSVYVIVK